MKHVESHNHPPPPWIGSLDIKVEDKFNKTVSIGPEIKNIQLIAGAPTREPIHELRILH